MAYDDAFARVAEQLQRPRRPLLVAVDGGDGVGKTWFADELATLLRDQGVDVVRATVDDFHHPRTFRHSYGRTGRTVWERSFDYRALRRELLDPWRQGAGSLYRRRFHDLDGDGFYDDEPEVVPQGGVLVFDGVFAQRPELANAWDLVVWLDAPDDVRAARMAARDGSAADLAHPDQRRYLDAQKIYREACNPGAGADVFIDNTHLAAPLVTASRSVETCPTCLKPWSVDDPHEQ